MSTANERQVAGDHYRAARYQHWDLAVDLRLGYFEGQVSKYISRAPKKNGVQDLRKADHFLEKMMEAVQYNGYPPIHDRDEGRVEHLAGLHSERAGHDPITATAIHRIVSWTSLEHLQTCQRLVGTLIDLALRAEESAEATSRYVGQ